MSRLWPKVRMKFFLWHSVCLTSNKPCPRTCGKTKTTQLENVTSRRRTTYIQEQLLELYDPSPSRQAKTLTKLGFHVVLYFHPVNAAWTPWGAWASCSITCGEGTRERSRECVFSHPECKGKTCSDEETGTRDIEKCFQTGAHSRNKKVWVVFCCTVGMERQIHLLFPNVHYGNWLETF